MVVDGAIKFATSFVSMTSNMIARVSNFLNKKNPHINRRRALRDNINKKRDIYIITFLNKKKRIKLSKNKIDKTKLQMS